MKIKRYLISIITLLIIFCIGCTEKDELNGLTLKNDEQNLSIVFEEGKLALNQYSFHMSGTYKRDGNEYDLTITGLNGSDVYFTLKQDGGIYVLSDNYEDSYDGLELYIDKKE